MLFQKNVLSIIEPASPLFEELEVSRSPFAAVAQ
jgi:hypothetical protein